MMENMQMLLELIRASLRRRRVPAARLLAILILVIGWLIAKAVRFAIVRMPRDQFQHRDRKAASTSSSSRAAARRTPWTPGLLVYGSPSLPLMIAFNSLGLAYVTDLIGRIVLFVPKVMVAVLILLRHLLRPPVGAAVTTYCKNVGVGDAALLGRLAFYAIMAFVILIALDQLGLGEIIKQTFLILVAAIGLALALAFGIGGAKRAGELLENMSRQQPDKPLAPGKVPPGR
jgi:small-conductance mechanosensitive channel